MQCPNGGGHNFRYDHPSFQLPTFSAPSPSTIVTNHDAVHALSVAHENKIKIKKSNGCLQLGYWFSLNMQEKNNLLLSHTLPRVS